VIAIRSSDWSISRFLGPRCEYSGSEHPQSAAQKFATVRFPRAHGIPPVVEMVSVILVLMLFGNQLRIGLDEFIRQFRLDRDVQLGAHHDSVGNGLCAGVVVEEDIGALDVPVFQNGFESNHVRLQLFPSVEVIVSLIAVLVTPPLIEFASVEANVNEAATGSCNLLANGILEFRLVDESGYRSGVL